MARFYSATLGTAPAFPWLVLSPPCTLGYRRSLSLINPTDQLRLLHAHQDRLMQKFERRVGWLIPLVPVPAEEELQAVPRRGRRTDLARFAVLNNAPSWDRSLREAVVQSASYARRAGSQGDLEVLAYALTTVAALNQTYIRVKGDTFQAHNLLMDNPYATDGFINTTLEEIRRLIADASERRDEAMLEQLFRGLKGLARLYATIEYPGTRPNKLHANLAVRYLERGVITALHAKLVDTAMGGLIALGDAGVTLLQASQPPEVASIAKRIGSLAVTGLSSEELEPIILTSMEQLSKLILALTCHGTFIQL